MFLPFPGPFCLWLKVGSQKEIYHIPARVYDCKIQHFELKKSSVNREINPSCIDGRILMFFSETTCIIPTVEWPAYAQNHLLGVLPPY